jgi:hypothetical protein
MVSKDAAVSVRVVPEGSAEFHSVAHLQGKDVIGLGAEVDPWSGTSVVGEPTYVLYEYEPSQLEQCEIDHERIAKEYGAREHGHRLLIPRWNVDGHREIRPPTDSGDQAPAPAVVPESDDDDLVQGLAKLGELHDNGTLTDSEFADAKARLLGSPES